MRLGLCNDSVHVIVTLILFLSWESVCIATEPEGVGTSLNAIKVKRKENEAARTKKLKVLKTTTPTSHL